MKIIVSGGDHQADFVIHEFKKNGNKIVVINEDEKTAHYLSSQNGIDVFLNDPTKVYSYEEASVYGFDLIISLLPKDEDNFVACSIAKRLFGVRKAICTVNDPDNVRIFKSLGVDSPISASYLLTERIKGESDVESLIQTLSLENDKITITEFKVKRGFLIVGKPLRDFVFPKPCNVCCLYRDPSVLIPRGDTEVREGDTLILASASSDQDEVVAYLRKEK